MTRLPRRAMPAIAALLGFVVITAIAGFYTHNWPPTVIVNSMSMMHRHNETNVVRIGTLNPGDLALVKRVDTETISVWAMGGANHYGAPGEVIVFTPPNHTQVIHRAMTWVDVIHSTSSTAYVIRWASDRDCPGGSERIVAKPSCVFGSAGLTIPELGFANYTPEVSGFLTKGDNPVTNTIADQQAKVFGSVQPEWIVGVARGELPWIGLLNLMVQPQTNEPICANSGTHFMWVETSSHCVGWVGVGHAFAPRELWGALIASLVVLIGGPLAVDAVIARKKKTREASER